MPVVATLKEILALCWRERATALKFGLVPIAINFGLLFVFTEAGEPSPQTIFINWLIGMISILAFAPFCVAWYRMILFGKGEVALRFAFKLGLPELKFFGWSVAISILIALVSVIAFFIGGGIVVAFSAINPILGVIAGFAMVLIGLVTILMILSRWSIALAMVAAGHPAGLQSAWDISKPYGWGMAYIQLIIFALLAVVATIPLAGYLPDLITAAQTKADPPDGAATALELTSTFVGALALWLTTTMFALVYRRIIGGGSVSYGSQAPIDDATRTQEMDALLAFLKKFFAENSKATIPEFRAAIDRFGTSFPIPSDVSITDANVGGVPGKWIMAPGAREDRVVLYLHGGGFRVGSSTSHARQAADLSRETGARVLVIDYALAPEHPFPAAIDGCVAAYRGLLENGVKPEHIALAGDSAGGSLVISTLLKAREQNLARPSCGVCMSPWVNLACDGETYETKKAEDPLGTYESLFAAAQSYLAGANPKDPLASPYLGDLTGLPPLLIQVGTREVLLDDSRRLANAAHAVGVDVTLEEWPGMIHNWQMMAGMLSDGQRANARIGEFMRMRWSN